MSRHSSRALVLAVAAGCGGQAAEGRWTGWHRPIDGIEIVWNEGPLAAAEALSLIPLWRVPSPPIHPDDTTFESPLQVRADARAIYVLDPPAGRVAVFDWDGALRQRIGRRGQGPGELLRPSELLIMEPDLGVVDRGAVRWFDSLGVQTRTDRLPFGMVLSAWPLVRRRAMFGSPLGWWVGVPGDSLSLIVPPFPRSRLAPDWTTTGAGSCGRVVPQHSGLIFRVRCTTLVVQVLDRAGAAVREFGVPDQPEIVADADLVRAESTIRARDLRQGVRPELAAMHAEFSGRQLREKPRYRDVRSTDSTLVVWEQAPVDLGDGTATIHVFTVAGIYLGRIPTNELWLDFDLHQQTIAALAREPETGLAYVAAYRIVVPPAILTTAARALAP